MKKTLFFPIVSYLLLCSNANAQDYKRTWNWYFGDSVGLSFNTGLPIKVNGNVGAVEGPSSISDTSGQLLFYTSGEKVWNKNHQLMLNGTGLYGHWSSTQASIIVPQPDNDSLFYIFTTDAVGQSKGLQYSIVNLKSNAGTGAIIVKNILLQTPVCEKLAATKHQNGRDVWVVAHGFGSNTFFTYLITPEGLIDCPVISNIGSVHSNSSVANAQGQMKIDVKGKKIAVSVFDVDNSSIDLFDFDNLTGRLQNYIPITNLYLPFNIEFSRNSKKLYTSTRGNELIVYDISQYNQSDIENSKTVLVDYPNSSWIISSLQLAVDSKIYVLYSDSFYLGSISYPDSSANKCQYNLYDVSMGTKRTKYGFPNFISSYFYNPNINFTYSALCSNSSVAFEGKASTIPSSWNWTIKRLYNGNITNYSSSGFTYTFPDSGWYEVRLIANTDTVVKNIFIDAPILPISDTLGCGVDSVVLKIPATYRCLQWNDTAALLYNRIIKTNGIFTVQGYNSAGCLIKDSIKINFSPTPLQPTITKVNDSLQSSLASTYQWLLNDTLLISTIARTIKPTKAGLYKVLITDSNGCSNMSTAFSSNVGIKPITLSSIRIYPNPANDILNIESGEAITEIKIYDITGQTVFEKLNLSDSVLKINLKEFNGGIYFIKINANLNSQYSKKIIIQ